MNEIESILKAYYNNYDEDSRLVRDKTHSIEYITTTNFIDKFLKKGDRILEIGAGTGRYSINYASKGYQVDSVELINKNLNILKSKINEKMKIKAIQGNILDLHMYDNNTFDITLVLGPLYHLYEESDIERALSEAIRVTKKGGKIFIAYITDDAVIMSYGVRKRNLKKLKSLCNDNWKVPKLKEEIFSSFNIDEFDKIIEKFDISKIDTIATDGIAPQMALYVNNLDDEEFEIFLDYHLKTCNRRDLMGYSCHILEIVEKK
ncbi:MAG: class I SAM-dependent methyltransferase [Clostridia bacterium]|nr:class I SAM-dependent methyltransferase [Clostridia bacterium]